MCEYLNIRVKKDSCFRSSLINFHETFNMQCFVKTSTVVSSWSFSWNKSHTIKILHLPLSEAESLTYIGGSSGVLCGVTGTHNQIKLVFKVWVLNSEYYRKNINYYYNLKSIPATMAEKLKHWRGNAIFPPDILWSRSTLTWNYSTKVFKRVFWYNTCFLVYSFNPHMELFNTFV